LGAKLPNAFWEDAAKCFVYVRNAHLTRGLNGNDTPISLWSEKKPVVSHYVTFGCLAYYRVHDQLRQKLDAKANKAIFVGYSEERRAYKLFDVCTKKYVEARNVSFLEDVCGGDVLGSKSNPEPFLAPTETVFLSDSDDSTDSNGEPEGPSDSEDDHNLHADTADDVENDSDSRGDNVSEHGSDHSDVNETSNSDLNVPNDVHTGCVDSVVMQGNMHARKKVRKTKQQRKADLEKELLEISKIQQERVEKGLRPQTRAHHTNDIALIAKTAQSDCSIPVSYKQAIKSPEKDEWQKAMTSELTSLANHNVWELVDRPKMHKVIKSKWVYSKKYNCDGSLLKYKPDW